jgi:type VI secretion system protein
MHRVRFLERLRAWEAGHFTRFKEPNEQDLINSIVDHIGQILNTKQGNVMLHSDYGVPDFHNLTSSSIEATIRDVISKYESRFIVDKVMREQVSTINPSKIKISITGKIKGEYNPIVITTVLTANGRVFVKL